MAVGTPATPGRLAELLDHLFRTVLLPPANGKQAREYRYVEVADAINDAAGFPLIAPHYLSYLRKGVRGGTGRTARDKLRAIEDFFGVPAGYLTDETLAAQANAQLDVIAALRNAGVRAIAIQADGLPPAILDTILQMTRQARVLAGLPPIPGQQDPPSSPPV